MRLLNTSTLQLEFFVDADIPRYAILSHRWQDEEVIFEDMPSDQREEKAGWKKVTETCRQAVSDGYEYVWIDTCCIDKRNSAELSEAINSMYNWYRTADICYTYLVDVPDGVDPHNDPEFSRSVWFTRGWTLQELVAPSHMTFFSHDWGVLGEKKDLHGILSKVTGIDSGVLTGVVHLSSISVAKRMSWAAKRVTSRLEDIAYSLMGIFDVNMPMIYGEGEKAFIRLQEEIMQETDDESLFAWVNKDAPAEALHGLLAKHPSWFAESGKVIPYGSEGGFPFFKTNKGLQISFHLTPTTLDGNEYEATINCPVPPDSEGFLAIHLKRLAGPYLSDTDMSVKKFARIRANEMKPLTALDQRSELRTLYVPQNVGMPGLEEMYPEHFLTIRRLNGPEGYFIVGMLTEDWPKQYLGVHGEAIENGWGMRFVKGQTSFPLSKKYTKMVVALIIRHIKPEEMPKGLLKKSVAIIINQPRKVETIWAVLLGTGPGLPLAADVCELRDRNFHQLQESFNPRPIGAEMKLGEDWIRINAYPTVPIQGQEYYVTDVRIESEPRAPTGAKPQAARMVYH